ncbi:MAG: DUF2279 domain-containing protein [Chitinophagaceae bacterium]|nr:DUF2279 domain-containing protein [Chitinophagaceae bacterium]
MRSTALLLSSSLASLRLSSRSLLGIMIVFLFSSHISNAQSDSTYSDSTGTLAISHPIIIPADSPFIIKPSLTPRQIKNRTWLVGGANVVGYSGILYGLSQAWYKDFPKSKFHSFNDSKEWLQVDKVGHFFGAYIESRASTELWKWTGMDRKKYIWIGGLSGAAYQTVIEVLDGHSADWGWSWSDFGANLLGSGTYSTGTCLE